MQQSTLRNLRNLRLNFNDLFSKTYKYINTQSEIGIKIVLEGARTHPIP